jgi:hypothetical protein
MPKVSDTRKQKAAELVRRLTDGPSWSIFSQLNPEEATRQFKLWSSSWILPVVRELVPELRVKK